MWSGDLLKVMIMIKPMGTYSDGTILCVCVCVCVCVYVCVCVCERVCAGMLGHVRLFASPGTVACQAPLSMGLSRQGCWSGLPFPCPVLRWVSASQHVGERKTLALGVQNLRGLCKKKHIELWLLGSGS